MKLFKLWKTYSNFTSIHCTFLNTHTPFQENPWRILSQVSWIHTQQFCNVAQCLAAWQRQGSTPVSDVTLYQQRTARSKIIVKYQWNKFMKGRPRGNIFLWKNFESTGWHFRAVYRAEMSTRALKEDDIIHAIVYLDSNYNHVLLLTVWCIVLRHISFCNSVWFLVVLQWSLLLGSLVGQCERSWECDQSISQIKRKGSGSRNSFYANMAHKVYRLHMSLYR